MEHDMNVRNMMWRPKLVKLTLIKNPEVDAGEPTVAYVDPQDIITIRRTSSSYMTKESYGQPPEMRKYHAAEDCTEVHCGHSILLVRERPEEIARARDAAFGHEAEDPAPGTVSNLRTV